MLNETVFKEGIDKLTAGFRMEINKETMDVYYEHLRDLDTELFQKAIKETLLNCNYFPKIAELRAVVREMEQENEVAI